MLKIWKKILMSSLKKKNAVNGILKITVYYCILLYTTCRIVVFMIKHISIVVADRKTKGRKSMLIEREDRI